MSDNLPEPGALPLYRQLSELLIRDIAAGRLADGQKLLPERQMAASLDVAVGTLRAALTDLTDKGLLQRVQGSGNYIRALPAPDSVYAMFRLELLAGGGLPTAQVLDLALLPKPADLPGIGPGAMAHRIRRLRFLSGVPAAVEEIWLDAGHAPGLTRADLSESLYLTYREKLGLWIARAEDRIGQAALPDWAPAAFPPAPGRLLPQVLRLAFDQRGQPCETSRTWYDPDTVRYTVRLK